jgi:adenylate cyclase
VAADGDAAATQLAADTASGAFLLTKSAIADHDRQHDRSLTRRRRVLNAATWITAMDTGSFGVIELIAGRPWYATLINGVAVLIFVMIPLLHRFGELVAPLALVCTANVLMILVSLRFGTHGGMAFFFLMSTLVAALVLGIERIVLAGAVVAISAALSITVVLMFPPHAGDQPGWATDLGIAISTICSCVMIMATVWYALGEIERARKAIEQEYERSESLLTNILPTSVAARLKNPATTIIADKYDDASVLLADIAGYTERASQITPADLVNFLNRVYSGFDRLIERHGLEKVKTTGDCYMVVSGVPQPRPDHLEALARFALGLAEVAKGLTDHTGQKVPIRIGLSTGPVVAGVVGTCRFFYDVWGDAVNVASRMESTGAAGRIQVPQDVYERLKLKFVFEERGELVVKGKGVLRTWFLVGEGTSGASRSICI